jgi:hypothetical protein
MWNHIRGPPYAGMRDGKPEIFAPGFSQQYVGETQAIGILCKSCHLFNLKTLLLRLPLLDWLPNL